MTLPEAIQRMIDAGTIKESGCGAEEIEYDILVDLPDTAETDEGVLWTLRLWPETDVFEPKCEIEANYRYSGPETVYDGDVEGAELWINEHKLEK